MFSNSPRSNRELRLMYKEQSIYFQAMKVAINRFGVSKTAVEELAQAEPDSEILVPLTSSLYIPGQISSVDSVLVDIGTGYHIRKQIPEAVEYLEGRVEETRTNAQAMQASISQKPSRIGHDRK
eukprot:GABV01004387.1.p1 GENE.GABV01004387.1~~GABV01004387.1.p1  ORF type:complete len:124 (-),score=28.28 GABV01004387.1:89-460(-)